MRGLASSGDYENFKMEDETRVHHLVDGTTGKSVSDKQSITVLARDAIWADYLATSLFLLPTEKALMRAESLFTVEIMIVDSTGKTHTTPGMAEFLTKL